MSVNPFHRILLVAAVMCCAVDVSAAFRTPIEDADVVVDDSLSFREKVLLHKEIYLKIDAAWSLLEDKMKEAERINSLGMYRDVVKEADRVYKYQELYSVAYTQAEVLKDSGYVMTDWTGTVCNAGGACAQVDPMVGLFMLALNAVVTELNKERPFDPQRNDLVKFLLRPAGGDNSEFVKLRSMLIPQHDNGEISRLLRDPVKRPIEVIQNVRDAIIPPNDNGEIARIIRDPVNCTIGRFFGGCK